jgi:hypothetical protein
MTAWISFALLFVVPSLDLAMRLLGAPAPIPALISLGAAAGLLAASPRPAAWHQTSARVLLQGLGACLLLAICWYVLRVSAFTFSPYGENIYDLHYIASLAESRDWPAPELWNPGTELSRYYYLGFYVVAFYARTLGLHPATVYALFLLVVPVVVFANYWSVMKGRAWYRVSAAFAATFPSTGLSLLIASGRLDIGDHVRGMAHVRLPEWSETAPAGGFLSQVASGNAYPVEGLTHLLGWLGDLHPPVFTFLLLAIVLCALSRSEAVAVQRRAIPMAALLAGAAVPLSFALNPWTFPCFALLGTYAVLRHRAMSDVLAGAIGAGAALLLLAPLFFSLDLQTGSVTLAWLPAKHRSSLPLFVSTWGPLLAVSLLLALLRIRMTLALPFIAMVVGLEILLLDDPYGERYERFNGVLKIGSLALAGWTASVLIAASNSSRHWAAAAVLLPLLAVSLLQLADAIAPSLRTAIPERNWGLQPVRMLQREDHRLLYSALSSQCPGLTLERRNGTAYTDSPLVSTLLGWPTYSGWPSHLSQIGAMDEADRQRSDMMQTWFERPETAMLKAWNVRYVLIDASLQWSPGMARHYSQSLEPDYRFVAVSGTDTTPAVGYFAATTECAAATLSVAARLTTDSIR